MYLKSLRHELLTSHIHICSRIGNAKTILHIGLGQTEILAIFMFYIFCAHIIATTILFCAHIIATTILFCAHIIATTILFCAHIIATTILFYIFCAHIIATTILFNKMMSRGSEVYVAMIFQTPYF